MNQLNKQRSPELILDNILRDGRGRMQNSEGDNGEFWSIFIPGPLVSIKSEILPAREDFDAPAENSLRALP